MTDAEILAIAEKWGSHPMNGPLKDRLFFHNDNIIAFARDLLQPVPQLQTVREILETIVAYWPETPASEALLALDGFDFGEPVTTEVAQKALVALQEAGNLMERAPRDNGYTLVYEKMAKSECVLLVQNHSDVIERALQQMRPVPEGLKEAIEDVEGCQGMELGGPYGENLLKVLQAARILSGEQ